MFVYHVYCGTKHLQNLFKHTFNFEHFHLPSSLVPADQLGREPDLAKAKKFSLQFLFSLTIGTYQVLVLFCQTGRFKP